MRRTVWCTIVLAFAFPVIAMTGCNSGPDTTEVIDDGHDHGDEDDHAHEDHEEGPHHGHIVELGDEEAYHLEWLDDDDAKTVTFYVLDGEAKEEVAIPAESLTVTITSEDGASRPYTVNAVREDGAETTSKFFSDQKEFFTILLSEGVVATVSVEIEGKSYEGKIEGGHDHHH
ncbi:MAG: hypothetical protein COA78_25385 [Blastopirellula sp.]|nr:MAG: hypothetical protein COA78_25385 [Blastopirellula sp.]